MLIRKKTFLELLAKQQVHLIHMVTDPNIGKSVENAVEFIGQNKLNHSGMHME